MNRPRNEGEVFGAYRAEQNATESRLRRYLRGFWTVAYLRGFGGEKKFVPGGRVVHKGGPLFLRKKDRRTKLEKKRDRKAQIAAWRKNPPDWWRLSWAELERVISIARQAGYKGVRLP